LQDERIALFVNAWVQARFQLEYLDVGKAPGRREIDVGDGCIQITPRSIDWLRIRLAV
jgi:hypothetical protein